MERLTVKKLEERRHGFGLIQKQYIDIVAPEIKSPVNLSRIKLKVAAVKAWRKLIGIAVIRL